MFERKGQKLGSVVADAAAEPGGAVDEVEEELDEVEEVEEVEDPGEAEFESTTVAELKEQLAAQGLPTSGNKAELWDRLHDETEEE